MTSQPWEHDIWVRHGWCPAIRRGDNAWCNRRTGHEGDHMVRLLNRPTGSDPPRVDAEYWPDSQRQLEEQGDRG